MMKKRNTRYNLNSVDYIIFIVFSLLAAFMLYLFYKDLNSFTIKQNEQPIAKISFKRNTAQRRFVDNDVWEILTDSSAIYDGDRIRTSKNSEATADFLGTDSQIKLGERSMVQIFKNKKRSGIDFIGGEIFIENNSLEEVIIVHSNKKQIKVAKASEVKIYTPEQDSLQGEKETSRLEEIVIEVISGQVEIEAIYDSKITNTENDTIILTSGDIAYIGEDVNNLLVNNPSKVESPTSVDATLEEYNIPNEENILYEGNILPEDNIPADKTVDEEKLEEPKEMIKESEEKLEVEDANKIEQFLPLQEKRVEKEDFTKVSEDSLEITKDVEEQGFTVVPRGSEKIYENVYNDLTFFIDKENSRGRYQMKVALSNFWEDNYSIPKGSKLNIKIFGIMHANVDDLYIQLFTGSKEAHKAISFYKDTENEWGMIKKIEKGEYFYAEKSILLDETIKDTADAYLLLYYKVEDYKDEDYIENLKITINVE